MIFNPAKRRRTFTYTIWLIILLNFACGKDTDLLKDSVLKDDDVAAIEEEPAEQGSQTNPKENTTESRTTSFSPIHDAHVQSGRGYNQNIIRLEENNRTSYLMFDLSPIDSIGGQITAATLQLKIFADAGSGTINVNTGSSNDWTETDLSDSSAPTAGAKLGTIVKEYKLGKTESIVLDTANIAPKISSLVLSHIGENALAFASKEHTQKIGPKLVVTYQVAKTAEQIANTSDEATTDEETTEENKEPIAVADASPISGTAPLEVKFTGSNSTDDVKINEYSWTFKKGAASNQADPRYTFTDPGVYAVTLTVVDEGGLSNTDTVTITVSEVKNEAPKAVLTATPNTGKAPLEVSFEGSKSTDDNAIISYAWDLKNGNKANTKDFKYTYTEAGTYEVELVVKDENGLSDTATTTITVTEPNNEAPVAVVNANPTSGKAPLNVQFLSNKSTDDKAITSYFWNFKDGNTTSNINPSHSFSQPGNYDVELTVKDAEGASDTMSVTINVTPSTSDGSGSTLTGFYVSTSGEASNDGKSPSKPWSLEHAFDMAKAGDVIYVKAGNYGNKVLTSRNQGSNGNPIKFIGYRNNPGDITTNQGSTFNFGEALDASKMPLLQSSNGEGKAITLHDPYIHIENFQITGYGHGVETIEQATNVVLRNVIVTKVGNQINQNSYTGFGFAVRGNNTLIENCFVLNAGAEAIKLSNSDNSRVNYCKVYATNNDNPTDYYFLLTGGTNNSIVENSYVERAFNLSHGGHGFVMKDLAQYNTFRNCTARRTNIELNFTGVRFNTIDNCKIYGSGTTSSRWQARLIVFNGANNNTMKNIHIQDTWHAMAWADYDDGSVGAGGDRDAVSLGYDNTYTNITVKNTQTILNVGGAENFTAKASRNKFINCDFDTFDDVARTYYKTEDITFTGCSFKNGDRFVIEAQGANAPYSKFNASFQNCTWSNVNFTPPN